MFRDHPHVSSCLLMLEPSPGSAAFCYGAQMYVNWYKVNQDNRVACQGGGRRCGGCVWIFPTLVFATTMSTLLWVGKPVVVVPLLCSMYIHRPSLNKLATIMWSSRRKLPTAQHRAEVELRQAGGVFSRAVRGIEMEWERGT